MITKERATRMEGSFGTDKEHFLLKKIKARNNVIGFWLRGFFLNTERFAEGVYLNDTVSLGVIYPIPENKPTFFKPGGFLQCFLKTLAIENIVPQNQTYGIISDKFSA